jgi:tetratricopeptide (TPR) repeat protein
MVNDALLQDRAAVVNSNMLAKPNPTNRMDRIRDYEIQLALARRQRLEHNPALAKAALVALLEGRSPDEIKRTALLELALVARDENQLPRAQQIFAQFISRYPNDPSVPAVLLRQGLLYREMGVPVLALAKFYQVMTSALNLKLDRFEYYQSLVLQAQTEIADTYFLQAKYLEAADCFRRLLKSDSPDLNKALIQYKLIRSLSYVDQHIDVVAQAQEFVNRYPSAGALAEVRFLLANSLRQLGRTHESLQQVLLLLESKSRSAAQSPQDWAYWQQRTGNIIANQLYKEGNYLGALDVYEGLARLSDDVSWQVPVLYQIGLACERLNQYQKAIDTYTRIVSREKDLGTNATPGLRAVLDMAKWRKDFMAWDTQAERAGLEYKVTVPANKPAAPGL